MPPTTDPTTTSVNRPDYATPLGHAPLRALPVLLALLLCSALATPAVAQDRNDERSVVRADAQELPLLSLPELLPPTLPSTGARGRLDPVGLAGGSAAADAGSEARSDDPGFPTMTVAKWSALFVAAGTAMYGFLVSDQADGAFDPLESSCERERGSCSAIGPDGLYRNLSLEQDFQRVRALDRRARNALVVAQVGLATSAVLFILDLARSGSPDIIPFDPPRLQIGPDGVGLEAKIPVGGR